MGKYFIVMVIILDLIAMVLILVQGVCTNTCQFAFDGECDDGGTGSVYAICDVGSDCSDCGPRANAIKP